MVMDVPHYPLLVERLAKVLRPGGLLILVESELSYVSLLMNLLAEMPEISERAAVRVGYEVVGYASARARGEEQ